MPVSVLRSLLLTTLVLALSGCMNSVKRSADISPSNPIPTLMVTTFVDIATQDKITLTGVSDLKALGAFAKAAPDVFAERVATAMFEAYQEYQDRPDGSGFDSGFARPINDFLRSEGYNVVVDASRAKRADSLIKGYPAKQGDAWTHPEGATKHFNNRAFASSLYQELASGLGTGGREAFVSTYVLVTKEDAFLGEIPVVTIDIEVIDQNGQQVFAAQGMGKGQKARTVDLSPQNLRLALDAAFAALRDS